MKRYVLRNKATGLYLSATGGSRYRANVEATSPQDAKLFVQTGNYASGIGKIDKEGFEWVPVIVTLEGPEA